MTTRSLILSTGVRVTAPVLMLFAVYLFLKGHNAPGGGFIAGLLTSAALVLRFLARGRHSVPDRESPFLTVIAVGLAIALSTAAGSALLGHAFFTHTFGFIDVPLLGRVEFATASLFDLGVYLVVVGNVVTVISAMTDKVVE